MERVKNILVQYLAGGEGPNMWGRDEKKAKNKKQKQKTTQWVLLYPRLDSPVQTVLLSQLPRPQSWLSGVRHVLSLLDGVCSRQRRACGAITRVSGGAEGALRQRVPSTGFYRLLWGIWDGSSKVIQSQI